MGCLELDGFEAELVIGHHENVGLELWAVEFAAELLEHLLAVVEVELLDVDFVVVVEPVLRVFLYFVVLLHLLS